MTGLSDSQTALSAKIKRSALIWGVIAGLVVGGIAYWLLSGQAPALRSAASAGVAALVAIFARQKSIASGSAQSRCNACNTPFSITRTDRSETLTGSQDMEKTETLEDGSTKTTTWIAEEYEVTETWTCAKCGDITHKHSTSNRKRDETETLRQAVDAKTGDTTKQAKQGKPGKSQKNRKP
jgi:hypothetical protein